MEVPPASQAASTSFRTAGSMLSARWNSPRVVTTFAPEVSSRPTSSMSQAAGMYSTQSAPSAKISSMSRVAVTPVAGSPHNSPTSFPALAGVWTYTPAKVMSGCSMTDRSA
jgi:hypothetical protein